MSCTCGCCAGVEILTPEAISNRPGLSAIAYRVGCHATFYETMVARLSSLYLDLPAPDGSGMLPRIWPLKALATRDTDDPAIALLDAWAIVADVLTFYQERIANEGYLPTATERRSIFELARLVGYRPRPGVSASVYLAFTASKGFDGVIAAGARAQSVPATSDETAQYFETSEDLAAREAWNFLAPRLTRPQVITQPATIDGAWVVTGADVIDTLYLDGISLSLKTGDTLLFVLGSDTGQQVLRAVQSVSEQSEESRTLAVFSPSLKAKGNIELDEATQWLQLHIDKATQLFSGGQLAAEVAAILTTLKENINLDGNNSDKTALVRAAAPQIRERLDTAISRDFTRVAAWLEQVLQLLTVLVRRGSLDDNEHAATRFAFVPSRLDPSPLGRLSAVVSQLALAPSLQPRNARNLSRSVARSFTPESDIAPRLLATLKPAAAGSLYQAWSKVSTPVRRVEAYAARVKAGLFAGNYAGAATTTRGTGFTTSYTPPTIETAWVDLMGDGTAPQEVPLDAVYDQIKVGSWVAIRRPAVNEDSPVVSYHRVTEVRTATMDTTTGLTAKVTLLTLDPTWDTTDLRTLAKVLRETIVYAQTELLELAEEPLDTDILGSEIELATAYDGLDAGRWIIVSGNRTDVTDVSGVSASELVMVSAVEQGSRAPRSADFPLSETPFSTIHYTTHTNGFGDRLVVGKLRDENILKTLKPPEFPNQRYTNQVELAPGVFANAYVPTGFERGGAFPDFDGLLVDPDTGVPLSRGEILQKGLFAWRVSSEPFHTILTLANSLAYTYDTRTIKIYGNVAKATHGQTVGEVLGDGDALQEFQSFTLRQSPLTHVSAPTVSGTESTLEVRVNEVEWHEEESISGLGPRDRNFVTAMDDDAVTTVTFGNGRRGARLPSGSSNVKAIYRYGIGGGGNVAAEQISQLATRPTGVEGVINPLAASGGADADSRDQARRNVPIAVMALDRLVSVPDYADFARNFAGIDKASSVRLTDGRRQVVHVTVAGVDDAEIDVNSDLYANLVQSLRLYGDPYQPIVVAARKVKLLVISAGIQILPDYDWDAVEPTIRAAMLAAFGFDVRGLGQSAFLSEAIAVMQAVEGVSYVDVDCFDAVDEDIDAAGLATLAATLEAKQFVYANLARTSNSDTGILPAELVYLTESVADTLILKRIEG